VPLRSEGGAPVEGEGAGARRGGRLATDPAANRRPPRPRPQDSNHDLTQLRLTDAELREKLASRVSRNRVVVTGECRGSEGAPARG